MVPPFDLRCSIHTIPASSWTSFACLLSTSVWGVSFQSRWGPRWTCSRSLEYFHRDRPGEQWLTPHVSLGVLWTAGRFCLSPLMQKHLATFTYWLHMSKPVALIRHAVGLLTISVFKHPFLISSCAAIVHCLDMHLEFYILVELSVFNRYVKFSCSLLSFWDSK